MRRCCKLIFTPLKTRRPGENPGFFFSGDSTGSILSWPDSLGVNLRHKFMKQSRDSPDPALDNLPDRRYIHSRCERQAATADRSRATNPHGVNWNDFFYRRIAVSVKHVTGGADMQGACLPDRGRLFCRMGDMTMSFTSSPPTADRNAGTVRNMINGTETASQNRETMPGGIGTRPDGESPSEIALSMNWKGSEENLKNMASARAKQAELRAAGLLKTPLERFLDNPRPLRAIRRFCYECNGYSHAAATNCENSNCALWLFRRGSSVITPEELPTWRGNYAAWMESAGESGRVSDDVESGADETEPLTEEAEG